MKMIKKVLAAVLAMAMVIGMMAMTAFAKDVTVTVKWDAAAGEEMSAWCWLPEKVDMNVSELCTGMASGNDFAGAWPGDVMTANADGTWSITYLGVPDDVTMINFIPSCSLGQTVDVKEIDASTGNVLVTVSEDVDDDGHFEATGEAVAAGGTGAPADDTPAGDVSLMIYVVAAVVALAGVVTVVCKRRSVEA